MGLTPVEADLDGDVPTFWIDGDGTSVRAGLLFRVGVADETLLTRGITALVLDLAIDAAGHDDLVEPSVELATSSLETEGTMEEVVERLQTLSAYLGALPLRRFAELRRRRIIGAIHPPLDAAGRHDSIDLSDRFGAQSYGLGAYDELALCAVDAPAVAAWCTNFFTMGNTALFFRGGEPPVFDLALPTGARVPCPVATSSGLPLPAHGSSGQSWVASITSVVPASAPSWVASWLHVPRFAAEGSLRDVHTDWHAHHLDGDHLAVWLAGGGRAATDAAVVAFWRALDADLRANGPFPDELRSAALHLEALVRDPHVQRGEAQAMARLTLMGGTPEPADDLIERFHAVTREEAQQAWCALTDAAIWWVPDPDAAEDLPGVDVRWWSSASPDGRLHRRLDPDETIPDHALAIGEASVSELRDDEHGVAVAFDRCAGYVRWAQDCRTIYGFDGTMIFIDPTEWRDGLHLVAQLDAAIPASKRIDALVDPPLRFDG